MVISILMIMQKKDLSKRLWHLNRFTLVRFFSILVGNIGYACWRRHHWDGRFSSYYVHAMAKKLEKGTVPHIMNKKRHGPAAFLVGGTMLPPSQSQQHGRYAFKKIVELGLQPHDVCVDFGCGRLRVGQHLIGYLQPNRYWGLDVTDRLFQHGLNLLGQGTTQAKTPHLGIIAEPLLKQIAHLKPDYLICVSVIMHIPPHELNPFFNKLLRLMATQTRLLLFFDESSCDIRTESKSWAYSVANLTDHILRRHPHAQVSCKSGSLKGCIGKIAIRRSILIIEEAQGGRPSLPQNLRASFVHERIPLC
ncbi:MAG: class I SAM-dependent methyltransferase [Nitrospirales bacterium]|nr:class I SAM-dependent methyltransferase [Nitrospirales bacterium]